MFAPSKREVLKEFVGNLIAGAVFFGILLLLSWCLGQAIDKQAQIDEAQRAEVVRL
jgi:hypothetical protein